MSSSNSDQSQTPTTQTWVQNSGYDVKDWHEHIEEKMEKLQEPQAVYFQPFDGLSPVYCTCYGIEERFALLKIPPQDSGDVWTDWFPPSGICFIVTDKRFIGPQ